MKKENAAAADKLREIFKNSTSAEMEPYAFDVPNANGEETYATMLVAVSLDFFRRDHPKSQIRREVIYNEPGRCAGVRCMLFDGDTFICDGFAEAVSEGPECLPLSVASNRALKDALRTAGYGVPSWVLLAASTDKLIGEDGGSSVIGDALEAAANILGETDEQKPVEATATVSNTEPEEKPKKRRGRKPKNVSVAPTAESFEPEDVPAPADNETASNEPTDGESSMPDATPNADPFADVVTEAEKRNTGTTGTVWERIPDDGNTVESLSQYLPNITEEDIRDVKMPFGHNANRTIGELSGTDAGRRILRQYCDSGRLKGSKVWVALVKACEIYGM